MKWGKGRRNEDNIVSSRCFYLKYSDPGSPARILFADSFHTPQNEIKRTPHTALRRGMPGSHTVYLLEYSGSGPKSPEGAIYNSPGQRPGCQKQKALKP